MDFIQQLNIVLRLSAALGHQGVFLACVVHIHIRLPAQLHRYLRQRLLGTQRAEGVIGKGIV